jgi:hypothetical protein
MAASTLSLLLLGMASAQVALGHGLIATIQFDGQSYPGWPAFTAPYANPKPQSIMVSVPVGTLSAIIGSRCRYDIVTFLRQTSQRKIDNNSPVDHTSAIIATGEASQAVGGQSELYSAT